MKIKFDNIFKIGASFSGPQTEGFSNKINESNWDYWFRTEPNVFFENNGPQTLWNLSKNYKKVINLAENVNLSSIRTSIQWTRLISNFNTCELDPEGVKFYINYFKYIKSKNIELHVCLHHFDMPHKLELEGGWNNIDVVYKFVEYSNKCFELFGDIVDKWITINEPLVIADSGYVYGYHLPQMSDFKTSINVIKNLWIANALVIKKFRNLNIKSKIGICLNLTPGYPFDSKNKEDVLSAKREHIITNNIFLYPSIKGVIDKNLIQLLNHNNIILKINYFEKKLIENNTVDFLGVNYYAPVRLKEKKIDKPLISRGSFFEQAIHPLSRINDDRGWEIFGKGLYDIAIWIKNEFNNIEWFVSENGIGISNEEKFLNEGKVIDSYRISFYEEHLYWLNQAIKKGANCIGYNVWTLCDNWSWLNAFKNRYGLYRFDINNNDFTIKSSGEWMQKFAKNKFIDINNENINMWKKQAKEFEEN